MASVDAAMEKSRIKEEAATAKALAEGRYAFEGEVDRLSPSLRARMLDVMAALTKRELMTFKDLREVFTGKPAWLMQGVVDEVMYRQRLRNPFSASRRRNVTSPRLLDGLDQIDIGPFDRVERNVPGVRLVPGKLLEVGAERGVFEVPAFAGKDFVAHKDELVRREALKVGGRQILPARIGDARPRVRLGRNRLDAAGRCGGGIFDRLNQVDIRHFNRAERDVPGARLVPRKLREVGPERVILEVPALAGKNFVARNAQAIG
jgi:hypothetical protein